MSRRDYSRCILGLDREDCFRGACRYWDRGKGCTYEPPEPAGKLGLQRRARPAAAVVPSRPIPEPGKAA